MLRRWHTQFSSLGLYLWDIVYNMTTKLVHLPNITRLSPRVLRILGQNPGQMTLQGTNCYLVHSPDYHPDADALRLCLIDTGSAWPTSSSFLPLLREGITTLGERGIKVEDDDPVTSLTDIVLTHRHPDHIGGLKSILAVFSAKGLQLPKVYKWRHPVETQANGENVDWDQLLINDAWPISTRATALTWLEDGHQIPLQQGSGSSGTTLSIVHTPGHTEDSVSLLIEETRELFTADTILGQGTSVFADLSACEFLILLRAMIHHWNPDFAGGADMASLNKVLELKPTVLYGGHGPHVGDQRSSVAKIEEYINHRNERERQILAVLEERTSFTPREIVEVLYAGLGIGVYIAAEKPVVAHLKKLENDGKVARTADGKWRLL